MRMTNRSDYTDDPEDQWAYIRYRGAVKSAIRGKRGQEFLKEALKALDALEKKELIRDELIDATGACCALGAVGRARNLPGLNEVDVNDYKQIAELFGIPQALAREIMYENDDPDRESGTQRFLRMREWILKKITNS